MKMRLSVRHLLLFPFVLVCIFGQLVESNLHDPQEKLVRADLSPHPHLRISPVSGGSYGMLRFSTVWKRAPNENASNGFPFRHRWKQFSFKTNVSSAPDGFPKPGASVRGIMLGDVCFSSKFIPCLYGSSYGTLTKITWMLKTLAEQGLSFWAMLGDNLYDEDGSVTEVFFSKLTGRIEHVPLLAVPGNHDFWTRGGPSDTPNNQFGYGYAQYYMVDTEAARGKKPDQFPFDFPDESANVNFLPSDTNFFHYSSIGAAGFIAFSGGHAMDISKFERACKYFTPGHPGEHAGFIFLLGHWSSKNFGCQENMFSARVHAMMSDATGEMKTCYSLAKQNRLFYVDGHFHENRLLGPFGVRVGGQGMIDTGTFGFPLFEIRNEKIAGKSNKRLLVSYISLAKFPDDPFVNLRFLQLRMCSRIYGVFGCLAKLSFVETWLNVTTTVL